MIASQALALRNACWSAAMLTWPTHLLWSRACVRRLAVFRCSRAPLSRKTSCSHVILTPPKLWQDCLRGESMCDVELTLGQSWHTMVRVLSLTALFSTFHKALRRQRFGTKSSYSERCFTTCVPLPLLPSPLAESSGSRCLVDRVARLWIQSSATPGTHGKCSMRQLSQVFLLLMCTEQSLMSLRLQATSLQGAASTERLH
mmetsp:Transcript_87146/g.164334  ORF Transcript_87146/g.164334 Transcript_87146/m.164334 type:complete len:201 (-) Transcript_87146:512-1114(-)